jgi:hypothetical protein
VALALSSCGGTSSSPTASSQPTDSTSGPATTPPTSTSAPSESPSGTAQGGTRTDPARVTATDDLLDWTAVPGSTKALVTVGENWTLTVNQGGSAATLDGPGSRSVTVRAGDHSSVTDAFLDADHALVVSEDRLAQQPDRATVVDLRSGRRTVLDGVSRPPTVVGGTWALGPSWLVHATSDGRGRYCLATVDLATGKGTTGWCAEPRHGFSRASVTSDGTTLMTFDDHHPSCRTLNVVYGKALTPFRGVTRCKGWDSALLDGTTVWSVVPNSRRIDAAHFYARTEDGWFDLGAGTSGSLVVCAGSAYFTRDPESRTAPAALMRWSPDSSSLSVAYESKGTGNAFLAPPRCGGSHLTVTSYSQAGDEQVTTRVG